MLATSLKVHYRPICHPWALKATFSHSVLDELAIGADYWTTLVGFSHNSAHFLQLNSFILL